eukprot:m.378543 g.378543  ORF g.378543 m.378543 type:complete len:192 (+) comp20933_c0_seq5:1284-1859(+)
MPAAPSGRTSIQQRSPISHFPSFRGAFAMTQVVQFVVSLQRATQVATFPSSKLPAPKDVYWIPDSVEFVVLVGKSVGEYVGCHGENQTGATSTMEPLVLSADTTFHCPIESVLSSMLPILTDMRGCSLTQPVEAANSKTFQNIVNAVSNIVPANVCTPHLRKIHQCTWKPEEMASSSWRCDVSNTEGCSTW